MRLPCRRMLIVSGVLTATVIGAVVSSTSAGAANTGDTTVTFTITGGTLDIVVPATANLGSFAPGGSATGALGAVTVTDTRAALSASWTATAVSTAFTTGAATTAETVAATAVKYWSGAATATVGTATFTPGQANAGAAVAIDTAKTAFGASAGTGNNSATWNPTLVIALPAAAVAGVYTGTVTQSVA